MQCEFETFVYKCAYDDIAHYFRENNHQEDNMSNEFIATKGKHQISFSSCDHHGCGEVTVMWMDKDWRTELHTLVTHTLRTYSVLQEWRKSFIVYGFTSAYLRDESSQNSILFFANPYVYGRERYHFCMVNFVDGNDKMQSTCPAQ